MKVTWLAVVAVDNLGNNLGNDKCFLHGARRLYLVWALEMVRTRMKKREAVPGRLLGGVGT